MSKQRAFAQNPWGRLVEERAEEERAKRDAESLKKKASQERLGSAMQAILAEGKARRDAIPLRRKESEERMQKAMARMFMEDLRKKEKVAEQRGDGVALNDIRRRFWHYHDLLERLEGREVHKKPMAAERKERISIAAKVLAGFEIVFSGIKMASSALVSIVKGVASALFAIGKGTFIATKFLVGLPVTVVKAAVSLVKLIGSAAKAIAKGIPKIAQKKAWAKVLRGVSGVLLSMVPFCGRQSPDMEFEASVAADTAKGFSVSAKVKIGGHAEREASRKDTSKGKSKGR